MEGTFESHVMSKESTELSAKIRGQALELSTLIAKIPGSRERSLAHTKLEECVMWANKALALYGCWEK